MPLLQRFLQGLARHGEHLVLCCIRIVRRFDQTAYHRIGVNRAEPVDQLLLYQDLADIAQIKWQYRAILTR